MLSSEHGPEPLDFSGEEDVFYGADVKRPSKAARRREGRLAIQEELDDFSDLYNLPEGLVIPGVKA